MDTIAIILAVLIVVFLVLAWRRGKTTALRMEFEPMSIRIVPGQSKRLGLVYRNAGGTPTASPPSGSNQFSMSNGTPFTVAPDGQSVTVSPDALGVDTLTGTFTPDGSNPDQGPLTAAADLVFADTPEVAASMEFVELP